MPTEHILQKMLGYFFLLNTGLEPESELFMWTNYWVIYFTQHVDFFT